MYPTMNPLISDCRSTGRVNIAAFLSILLVLQRIVEVGAASVGDAQTSNDDVVVSARTRIATLAANRSRLDEFARRLMECRRIPGLVLTVVDATSSADGALLTAEYGWADVDRRRAMTRDTVHCVASCTKAFTSTLVGQLLAASGGRSAFTGFISF